MDQKRTKWRLDGHAWVISKIEKVGDLDEMLETDAYEIWKEKDMRKAPN